MRAALVFHATKIVGKPTPNRSIIKICTKIGAGRLREGVDRREASKRCGDRNDPIGAAGLG